jgi:adenine-specific DNA glycosylase
MEPKGAASSFVVNSLCCEGLWEFPSTAVPADASPKARSKATDTFLEETLGLEGWRDQVLERRGLGAITHIFSHIRMTMHVERLVIQVLPVSRFLFESRPSPRFPLEPGKYSFLRMCLTKGKREAYSHPAR